VTQLAEHFSSLCRTCLLHEPRETHSVALARFSSFAKGIAALGAWAEENPSAPAILLTSHAVPSKEDDLPLRDFLANNELIVDGVEVREAPDPYAFGIGLYHGRASSEQALAICEAQLHEKHLPRQLRALLTEYGWLRLNVISSVEIGCAHLPSLDDALADWMAAVEQEDQHPRYLLFAGDLDDGWVLDLAQGKSGAVCRFVQDQLAEQLGEQERRGEAKNLDVFEASDSCLDVWLTRRIDELILELADHVGIEVQG